MSHIGKPPCDDGVIAGDGPVLPCSAAARRWTMVAAVLGSSMAFIDGTVVNVALPALQRELGATAAQAQWIIESYALFLASLLLVGGALGDRFGRRRIFMVGTALFTLASIGCAASASAKPLIAARALQGVGAALLVPGSLSLISATFPASERGQAIGTWSAFSGITAAVGPVVGGFLIDHYSWTWAFLMNAPLGLVLLAVCATKVPESRGAAARSRLDVLGAILATVALAGLVFALIEAPARGWSAAPVIGAAVMGIVALTLFFIVEAHSPAPMLPLGLFRSADFMGTNLLTLLLYAALGGGLFFFPLNLIQVQGYGATAAGSALLPFIAIMFLLSRWTGRLVGVVGPRLPLVAGPLLAAIGLALFAIPGIGGEYWQTFLPAVCVLGFGMAVTVAPLTTTVMNSVGRELAGVASGVNNAVSRAAGLLAIAFFALLMAYRFDTALEARLAALELPASVTAAVIDQRHQLAVIALPDDLDPAAADAIRHAVSQSFVAGFRAVMLACAALAALSALVSAALIGRAPPSGQG